MDAARPGRPDPPATTPLKESRRGGAVRDPGYDLSEAELREAERGLEIMLRRKRFSPAWIEENASDLLAQASKEYAEKLTKSGSADRPVGWLIHCAWRRAQNRLESQSRKPPVSSLESAFHLADEATQTPEQKAFENERRERLSKAMSHLPEKERELLALVYFSDHSIREAGRKLGWQKSPADRHHTSALERLRALVGEDRSLLSPATLGLLAWLAARKAASAAADAAAAGAHRVTEWWRKLVPLAEPGNAAMASGAGRAAGLCGAAVAAAVCGLTATGIVGAPKGTAETPSAGAAVVRPHHVDVTPARRGGKLLAPLTSRQAQPPGSPTPSAPPIAPARQIDRKPDTEAAAVSAPTATTRQTVEEFGVDRASGGASESAPVRSFPAPPAASSPSTPSSSADPSSTAKPAAGSGSSEFGL